LLELAGLLPRLLFLSSFLKMAAPTAFSEVDILVAQGDAATDPSLSVDFYEAAKKLPTNKTVTVDLLCKLSAAYLRRGREGDVSLAVVYSTAAASVRPDARAFLQCSKATLAQAVSQRTHLDCGESMRHFISRGDANGERRLGTIAGR